MTPSVGYAACTAAMLAAAMEWSPPMVSEKAPLCAERLTASCTSSSPVPISRELTTSEGFAPSSSSEAVSSPVAPACSAASLRAQRLLLLLHRVPLGEVDLHPRRHPLAVAL